MNSAVPTLEVGSLGSRGSMTADGTPVYVLGHVNYRVDFIPVKLLPGKSPLSR